MNRTRIALVSSGLLLAVAALWLAKQKPAAQAPPTAPAQTAITPEKTVKPGFEGLAVDQSWQAPAPSAKTVAAPRPDYGLTPETPAKYFIDNPQAQSNLAALKEPTKFPERLSPMIAGAAFDEQKWNSDPAYKSAYLAVSEPGRAFASSKNPQAPQLQRASSINPIVAQGEKIVLSVRATPGACVSFYSPHLNRFAENGLTHVTVVSDAQGLASVEMEGVPGTIGPTDVVASSPLASGSVTFKVETTQANVQVSK